MKKNNNYLLHSGSYYDIIVKQHYLEIPLCYGVSSCVLMEDTLILFVPEVLEVCDFYQFWMPRNIYFRKRSVLEGGSSVLLVTFHSSSSPSGMMNRKWNFCDMAREEQLLCHLVLILPPACGETGRNPQSISCGGRLHLLLPPHPTLEGLEGAASRSCLLQGNREAGISILVDPHDISHKQEVWRASVAD